MDGSRHFHSPNTAPQVRQDPFRASFDNYHDWATSFRHNKERGEEIVGAEEAYVDGQLRSVFAQGKSGTYYQLDLIGDKFKFVTSYESGAKMMEAKAIIEKGSLGK